MSRAQHIGGKVGPRLVELLLKALAEHEHRSTDHRAKVIAHGLVQFFDTIGVEKQAHISPFTGLLLGHPDTPTEVEQLLAFMHHGRGEASELLNMLGIGGAVSQPLTAALSNYLAPAQQDLIRQSPQGLLDPGTAASALTAGLWAENRAYDEANRAGINNERFSMLVRLAYQWPSAAELMEQLRRGILTPEQATAIMELQRLHPEQIAQWLETRRQLLGVPEAALAVLRGHISEPEGLAIAEKQGVSAADFGTVLYNTGEPPAAESMMEAYRRDFIDEATFDRAILQSRIRDEWIPVMKQLRYSPMPTADAVEAVVRNYISNDEGRAISQQNGLLPEHWPVLLESHGRPLALGQVLSLWNRDEFSEEQVKQAIRESDIKDKYVDAALNLRYKIPPEHLIGTLVEKGGMTSKRAYELLRKDGFEPDVAQSIVTAFGGTKVAKARSESEAQVLELYETHQVDEGKAKAMLSRLGYSPPDIDMLLSLSELRRERVLAEAAANAVRSNYIARRIDETQARNQLSQLGLTAERVGYLLKLWAVELAGHARELTPAEITKAVKARVLSPDAAVTRLQRLGYSQEDADVLVAIYG